MFTMFCILMIIISSVGGAFILDSIITFVSGKYKPSCNQTELFIGLILTLFALLSFFGYNVGYKQAIKDAELTSITSEEYIITFGNESHLYTLD